MKDESCSEWRLSLGAYALGDLPTSERGALEAHLKDCEGCCREVSALKGIAHVLPLADPAQFEATSPAPSPELNERIAAMLGAERRPRVARPRRRLPVALGGAVTAAAAALAIIVLPLGGGSSQRHVDFAGLPDGVTIDATFEPNAYGTEIQMYVSGIRSGTLCRVFLRGEGGARVPAGTFRYRWGEDSRAVLTSALSLSQTEAIAVEAGNRTYVAPVNQA